MISSLRSIFDFTERRALFITADAVSVFHWNQGITDAFSFDADDVGLASFARYLKETPNTQIYMLVDVVEEEFRQETIPHVYGSDRKMVLQRKQTRLFRTTPYFYTLMQGREPDGRRDDRVLLSGVQNPELISPWVKLCIQNKIPIAGIYSLPILSKYLLPRIGANFSNVLLVTMHSNSGLRQSYFLENELKTSRLAMMPKLGAVPFVQYIIDELDKTQRYLNSLRLMAPGPLDIFLLSHGESLDELNPRSRNTDTTRYHLIDVANVALSLEIQGALTTPFSDYLFAHLLLYHTPPNHYASREERFYSYLRQARTAMYGSAFLLLLGGAVISGFNIMEGFSLDAQRDYAEQMANYYQARLQDAKKRLPPTPIEPLDIKTGVDIIDTLTTYKTNPYKLMTSISHVLDRFPNLHLEEVKWQASLNPRAEFQVTPNENAETQQEPEAELSSEKKYLYYQIGWIKGFVDPFDGDYRAALAVVKRFSSLLRTENDVYKVDIITLPLDINPESSLQGSADRRETTPEATFTLKVVLGVGNDKTT